MHRLIPIVLLITMLIISVLVSPAIAGKGSGQPIDTDPDGEDVLLGMDTDDLTMAPTGTNKRYRLRDLPISDPAAAALALKQNASAQLDEFAALNCTASQIPKKNVSGVWICASDNEGVGGSDSAAIHNNVAGEIHAITEKTTGADADEILIESAANTYAKRRISFLNLWNYLKGKADALYATIGHTHATLGNLIVDSLTVTKTSGVASDMGLYEANSTDTHAAGFRGPASITGDGAYRGRMPNARATGAGQVMAWTNAGETGTGTAGDPYVQTISWITPTVTVASGTSALGTSAIASGACAAVVSTAAAGVATTDAIAWGWNTRPSQITGYGYSTNGALRIDAYPTAGYVNFEVCNQTSASITPGAVTLNWRVVR